jgi:hypothetical protein
MEELLNSNTIETKFAPAERVPQKTITYQRSLIDSFIAVKPFVDDINHAIVILNRQRQIVYGNKLFFTIINNDETFGKRLGEALDCIHSTEEIGGCGTSESCKECGAVNAIMNSHKFGKDEQECRITAKNDLVYDLNIWAKDIKIEKANYTVVSITDIGNEKRRKVLERIFFHDILNTAGSLRAFLELMQDCTPEELEEFSAITLEISNSLIDEIKGQRMLSLAEDSKLEIELTLFKAKEVFLEVINTYKNNYLGENKILELIECEGNEVLVKSDKTLLRRVLGNLTKNALEASRVGEKITLSISEQNSQIVFNIHNQAFIPRNIELQIFQRSFSTKGTGRGVGTYSVKLLTEKYLSGEASFKTDEKLGTTFTVKIPKEII